MVEQVYCRWYNWWWFDWNVMKQNWTTVNLAVRAGETSRLLQTRDGVYERAVMVEVIVWGEKKFSEILFWDKIVSYSSASFVASFSRGYTGPSLMQVKEVMPSNSTYVRFLAVISDTDHANVNSQFCCLVSLPFHAVTHWYGFNLQKQPLLNQMNSEHRALVLTWI